MQVCVGDVHLCVHVFCRQALASVHIQTGHAALLSMEKHGDNGSVFAPA